MLELSWKVRFQLWVIRFITAYVPLGFMQWLTKKSVTMVNLPDDITRENTTISKVECDWIIPNNLNTDHVLLYLHGGGFVFGQTAQHMEMAARLARKIQCKILMVDYRLAPEHPYPAALNDCITVFNWLVEDEGIDSSKIFVGGDSAGGNLTITMLMKLRDTGKNLPKAAVCLSPVIDLTEREHKIKDPVLPKRAVTKYQNSYVAGSDPTIPLISPKYGNWDNLSPMLIHAGDNEILKKDAEEINELTNETSTEVELEIFPDMFHVWQIYPNLPESEESLNKIAKFLLSKF